MKRFPWSLLSSAAHSAAGSTTHSSTRVRAPSTHRGWDGRGSFVRRSESPRRIGRRATPPRRATEKRKKLAISTPTKWVCGGVSVCFPSAVLQVDLIFFPTICTFVYSFASFLHTFRSAFPPCQCTVHFTFQPGLLKRSSQFRGVCGLFCLTRRAQAKNPINQKTQINRVPKAPLTYTKADYSWLSFYVLGGGRWSSENISCG